MLAPLLSTLGCHSFAGSMSSRALHPVVLVSLRHSRFRGKKGVGDLCGRLFLMGLIRPPAVPLSP